MATAEAHHSALEQLRTAHATNMLQVRSVIDPGRVDPDA